jgi:hypothetical protein
MKKYSFLSKEEPTDEMLGEIMHEVSVEAKEKSIIAEKKYWDSINQLIISDRK